MTYFYLLIILSPLIIVGGIILGIILAPFICLIQGELEYNRWRKKK